MHTFTLQVPMGQGAGHGELGSPHGGGQVAVRTEFSSQDVTGEGSAFKFTWLWAEPTFCGYWSKA